MNITSVDHGELAQGILLNLARLWCMATPGMGKRKDQIPNLHAVMVDVGSTIKNRENQKM